MHRTSASISRIAAIAILAVFATNSQGQKITNLQRGQVMSMLDQIAPDVQKHYYDPTFHGVDWNAEVEKAKQKIDAAKTLPQAVSEVAAAMMSLDDSHTFLMPPLYAERFHYGWQAQMIGDQCFITRVRPGSDAARQGLKPGDQILTLDGYPVNRDDLWKMEYSLNVLRPQVFVPFELRDPAGKQFKVKAAAKIVQKQNLLNLTSAEGGGDIWAMIRQDQNEAKREHPKLVTVDGVGVLRFPSFSSSASDIDHLIGKARKNKALVIDLRGDPGGREDTLQYLIGDTFDHDVTIGERVGRSKKSPLDAKTHHDPFTGKLIVLIDSHSASAAELYARVVQLEKRGTVVGDRSAGKVMQARQYSYSSGSDTRIFFGASITDADLIMTDGKSLEKRGVTPDVTVLPSGEDLAKGRDPVLARAVEIAGGKITPEAAGKLFPYKWPRM